MNLPDHLTSWAQNEENIDGHYLAHGRDCLEAAKVIQELAGALRLVRMSPAFLVESAEGQAVIVALARVQS